MKWGKRRMLGRMVRMQERAEQLRYGGTSNAELEQLVARYMPTSEDLTRITTKMKDLTLTFDLTREQTDRLVYEITDGCPIGEPGAEYRKLLDRNRDIVHERIGRELDERYTWAAKDSGLLSYHTSLRALAWGLRYEEALSYYS